jgi:hypothetical protein
MNARGIAIGGFIAALAGGVLAFALNDPNASAAGVKLESLGAVLLIAGGLALAAAGVLAFGGGAQAGGDGSSWSIDGLRTIGGLIAVIGAIVGVVALTVVTQARLGSDKADSIVAVATAAFGVISALVGAYLGIKVTADQSSEAQKQAQVAHAQLGAATAAAADLAPPEQKEEVQERMAAAAEEAANLGKKSRA